MAWPRDMRLFKHLGEYPFEERRKKYGVGNAIAEVCVMNRVERIAEAVRDVKHGTADEVMVALVKGSR